MTALRPVTDGPAIVVCSSCGNAAGARLAALLRAAQAADRAFAGISVQSMACLFACAAPCAVHLRAPGKIGYVLGRFAPDAAAADAILGYARAYMASAIGEVPFAQWPQGVHGRFLVRIPPAGFVVD